MFLRDLALAHQKHEGWFPGSLSQRNNNPGNLRLTAYQRKAYGAVAGAGGFARFPSYDIGLQALMDDLRAKITGHSAHINYTRNPTFLNYVRVYAPKEDGNNPDGYAQALIRDLSVYGITLKTPLSTLAKLISQPERVPVFNPREALRRLNRLIAVALEPRSTRLQKRKLGVE
jgi:hypothetical protein